MAGIINTKTESKIGMFKEAPPKEQEPVSPEEKQTQQSEVAVKPLIARKKQTRAIREQDKKPAVSSSVLNRSPSTINIKALGGRSPIKAFPPRTTAIDGVGSTVRQPKDDEGWGIKTFDFLFGPESAAIGIAHDSSGFSWNVENLKHQWSEQPLWVNALAMTSLVGTVLWPAGMAVRSASKFGKLATLAGRYGGEAAEIANWQKLGRVGADVKKFSDLGENADQTIRTLRQQQIAITKYTNMAKRADAVERGDLTWKNPVDYGLHQFEKRFANHYYEAITDLGAGGGGIKKVYHDELDKLWKSDTVGTLLKNLPGEEVGPKITAHLMERQFPELTGRAASEFGALNAAEKTFVDFYEQAARKMQQSMLDDGVITAEEYAIMGGFHLPALNKGTMNTGMDNTRQYLMPVVKGKGARKQAGGLIEKEVPRTGLGRLFGKTKTMIEPTDEIEYIAADLARMPRLDAPTLLERKGTPTTVFERLSKGKLITDPHLMTANGYLTDSLLHTNYKFITDIATNENYIATAADIAAFGGDIQKITKAGFVPLNYAGDDAAARIARMISKKTGRPIEALPLVRKEIFNEIFGKHGMMDQARMAGTDAMAAATTMYKTMKTAFSVPTHFQNLTGNMVFLSQAGFNPVEPKNVALMGEMVGVFGKIAKVRAASKEAKIGGSIFSGENPILKNIDLGTITVNGRKFNLNEEMFDPAVRELIEESAFDSVEGAGSLVNVLENLKKDQYATRAMIKGYMKAKNVLQLGGKAKWMDSMTKAYLAEDMVPKMAYFMHLRGNGLTKVAAATEVARRLPMYGTVGSSIKFGRKFLFPWATFPAEALRITKNNLMDNPIRMIPWLRAPQIMQSMVSGMGLAPETSEMVDAATRQLPFWAQKSTTVMMEGKAAAAAGGGLTGAVVGGIAGAALGKSGAAAAAGAAIGGGLAGLMAALTTSEDHDKELRGAVLDFLPHSTFMLSNTSVDFGTDMLPWRNTRGFIEQMPAEPLAILKPLLSVWSGETPYGEEIQGNGIAKGIAGMVGFLAPPLIQKYGFKLTTPDVSLFGGHGGVTNVSRFLTDTGLSIDPVTGKPGSLSHDFLLNNFGTWKTYAASGEQQLANEELANKDMGAVRNYLARNLAYHLENGNDKEAVDILSEVMATFSNQYADNPRKAALKNAEWQANQHKAIGKHPKMRAWSTEEIVERIRQTGAAGAEVRGQARDNMLKALSDELKIRKTAPSSSKQKR